MAAATNGRASVQTILDAIIDERQQLWTTGDAFAVTAVNVWPTGIKTFEFIGLVGKDREKWLGVLDDLLDWARERGCEMVETSARPGWKRVLKDWTCSHVFLEKKI